jgi:hypothetical protein
MVAGDPPILLTGPGGEPRGQLRIGALALIAEAETTARRENLAKVTAISATLRARVKEAGYRVTDEALAEAQRLIQQARHGQPVASIAIEVQPLGPQSRAVGRGRHNQAATGGGAPPVVNPPADPAAMSFFEHERVYPNQIAREWYDSLKGLDRHKEQLLLELELLLYPDRLEAWSRRHHGGQVLKLCERVRGRIPLILFEGDVGTGKTALAETVGDALARRNPPNHVHLLKINTQVRGTGLVGEMTRLIVQAFEQAEARARALKGNPMLLLLDEADALAASRDVQQMHHEDRAGLNTLLQRLDGIRSSRLPMAAVFITNRPASLDPAVRRRAALTLHFERPNDTVRAEIFQSAVPELKLAAPALEELVRLTGGGDGDGKVPFTASDLIDRLLPGALRVAYAADRPLAAEDLISQARAMAATPPFEHGPQGG